MCRGGKKELDRPLLEHTAQPAQTAQTDRAHSDRHLHAHTTKQQQGGHQVYLSRAMVKVAVKWNKRVFDDVEVTPKVADFKAKLQELTVRVYATSSRNKQQQYYSSSTVCCCFRVSRCPLSSCESLL